MPEDDVPGAELVPGGRATGDFSYSGDPGGSDGQGGIDTVRFLIGDTNPDSFFLSDAEIQWAIDMVDGLAVEHPLANAAGVCAEAIAAKLAREVTYSADGVSVSGDSLAQKFYTVAEKIRTINARTDIVSPPYTGGILVGEVYDPSIRPLVFSVGMHDNYLAGQQDYGGTDTGYWYNPLVQSMSVQNQALIQQAVAATAKRPSL